MLHKFRHLYPQGSLLSELVNLDHGIFVVKVTIKNQDVMLGSGLAADKIVEKAEDLARLRALMTLFPTEFPQDSSSQNRLSQVAKAPFDGDSPPTDLTPHSLSTSNLTNDPISQRGQNLNLEKVNLDIVKPASAHTASNLSSLESPQSQTRKSSSFSPSAYSTTNASNSPTFILEDQPKPLDSGVNDFPVSAPDQNVIDSHKQASLNIFNQPLNSPRTTLPSPNESTATSEPISPENETSATAIEFDFNEIKYKIDLEMKRLGWTSEQGRDYLLSTYGKRSRLHLKDEELLEFWRYLEALP